MTKVKCYLLLVLFLIMGLNAAHAQEKISVGLSSQIQSTKLRVNGSTIHSKRMFRPASALFAEYRIRKKISIHLGLGYARMTPNSEAVKNDFHHLIVPLHLKHLRQKEGKKLGFVFFYGTNLRYLLKAQHTSLNGEVSNVEEHIRPVQWDLVLGAGLKYKLSNALALEALASYSFGSMMNKANPVGLVARNINQGLMLNLTYTIK